MYRRLPRELVSGGIGITFGTVSHKQSRQSYNRGNHQRQWSRMIAVDAHHQLLLHTARGFNYRANRQLADSLNRFIV